MRDKLTDSHCSTGNTSTDSLTVAPSQRSGALLSDVEKCPLYVLNRCGDSPLEVMERWNHRLTPESLNILEEYLHHRIAIVLNLRAGGRTYRTRFFFPYGAEDETRDIVASIRDVKGNPDGGPNGEDQMVFISNVQCVEGPQGIIPSSVWLYVLNDARDHIEADSLYFSPNSGYHFLPRFPKCELRVVCPFSARQQDQLMRNVVEGSAQVVDGIANDQRNVLHILIRHFHRHMLLAGGIHLFLKSDTVTVRVKESVEQQDQLTDVMIGPFDL